MAIYIHDAQTIPNQRFLGSSSYMLFDLYFTGETAAIANTEVDASELASSSGAEAEAVRQVSPASNTSTVVNLAEKARQRAMLRHGGGGAPTALSPQNTRPWESSTWSTRTWTNS
jgi:hypothetical protein